MHMTTCKNRVFFIDIFFLVLFLFLPLVTSAMHNCRNAPVEEAIARIKSRNVKWTSRVVSSTTGIGLSKTPEIRVFSCSITPSAPLRTRYQKNFSSVTTSTSSIPSYPLFLLYAQPSSYIILRKIAVPALYTILRVPQTSKDYDALF